MFHFIASTGRTATTYLASFLNSLDGVCGCHESYAGAEKDSDPVLPVINLENSLCYRKPLAAYDVVTEKRSATVVEQVASASGKRIVVDVAYYNATIAAALLDTHPQSRMVAIIRDCASFVRSATCVSGEDPLPVGWPSADKPLTEREKFIALGRIKPTRQNPQYQHWKDWSPISKNIWLWQETNRLILEAARKHKNRSCILAFNELKNDRSRFLKNIIDFLNLPEPDSIDAKAEQCDRHRNSKPSGYQIGPESDWPEPEREQLEQAQEYIDGLMRDVR